MRCFACGASQDLASGERIGVRDCCASCSADLHVCRNCRHHDPSAYNERSDDHALPQRVDERERANRCDYFAQAEAASAKAEPDGREGARRALDALFGKP